MKKIGLLIPKTNLTVEYELQLLFSKGYFDIEKSVFYISKLDYKTNYKEDRAVIFEDMMFRSLKKEYYVKGNPINEKAKVISKQLSTYFDSVSDNVVEHWERFIAW